MRTAAAAVKFNDARDITAESKAKQILSSTDAFIRGWIARQTRVELRPSNPEGSRGFESRSLHRVGDFSDSPENRSKLARGARFTRRRGPGPIESAKCFCFENSADSLETFVL